MQNSVVFLQTGNKQSKSKFKKTIQSQRTKWSKIAVNVTKVHDLRNENYKALLKVITKYINKWRVLSCSSIRKFKNLL